MEYQRTKPSKPLQLIYGIRAVEEALKNGDTVEKIWIRNDIQSPIASELFRTIKGYDIPVQRVPPEKLNSLSRKNHQGIIASISPIEYQDITRIIPMLFDKGVTPLILILDQVTDVRNFGAICRSAECAGAHAVVIPTKGAAQINADAIKTSAGALLKIPVCRSVELIDTIKFLQQSGLHVVAATEKAKSHLYQTDLDMPLAIVAGSEDTGITPAIVKQCDSQAGIPILGDIASLNVSVACSLFLYEAVRQRGGFQKKL